MQELWDAWNGLDLAGQAVLIGIVSSAVVGLLKRRWPSLAASTGAVKQYLLAALAGVGAYLATGNILAAVVAFFSAIGGYEVYKEQVARRVGAKRGEAPQAP